jgi:hypothetical protein
VLWGDTFIRMKGATLPPIRTRTDQFHDANQDQRRAQNRIEILCGRGVTLSAHSRQANNPSIATVSQILSRATSGPTAFGKSARTFEETKAQVGGGFRDSCDTGARPLRDR